MRDAQNPRSSCDPVSPADPRRIDLSALEPSGGESGIEHLVQATVRAALPELARRAAQSSPADSNATARTLAHAVTMHTARMRTLYQIGEWARPRVLAAAATLLFAAGLAMEALGGSADAADSTADTGASEIATERAPQGLAAILEIREPVATWVDEERAPTRADLLTAVETEGTQ